MFLNIRLLLVMSPFFIAHTTFSMGNKSLSMKFQAADPMRTSGESHFLLALYEVNRNVEKAEFHLLKAEANGFLNDTSDSYGLQGQDAFTKDRIYHAVSQYDRYIAVKQKIELLKKELQQKDLTALNGCSHDETKRSPELDAVSNGSSEQEENLRSTSVGNVLHKLNTRFRTKDRSRIAAVNINENNQTVEVVISDPKRNEEIIVLAPSLAKMSSQIVNFKYNNKIASNQPFKDSDDTKDHRFAQMLDYVIQAVGDEQYEHKKKRADNQKFLYATVVRKDLNNNTQMKCIAEYAYYNTEDGKIVFHRLLRRRPNAQMEVCHRDFLLNKNS